MPRRLSAPSGPSSQEEMRARAAARYHDHLRVTELAPGVRLAPARQDGAIAYQAVAHRQYELALTSYRTRQALAARQQARSYVSQGPARSPSEIKAREREMAQQRASVQYQENVALISGEFAPLVLYDPVIKNVAQGGLLTMGGVGLGAVMPVSLRWLGTGYSAFRTTPWQVGRAMLGRGLVDAGGQYGAGLTLNKGWVGAFQEINWFESGMSAGNTNPYFIAVASAGLSASIKDRFQSVFYSEASGHNISMAKFLTQASVGMTIGHFGGKLEERLAENSYRAWRKYNIAILLRTPAWGEAGIHAGLRFGQAYGPPLLFGIAEETGEGFFGDGMDEWWKNPNSRVATPSSHPDSPVFRDNQP